MPTHVLGPHDGDAVDLARRREYARCRLNDPPEMTLPELLSSYSAETAVV